MADSEKYRYHPRRSEKEITDRAELLSAIRGQKYLSLAMCKDNEPYLVAISYGFSEAENCFYMHCANEGRKVDFIRANPRVWGVIVEDRGYMAGKCSHAFRTVMFEGAAEMVQDAEEKRRAVEILIDQLEPDPAPYKAKTFAKFKPEKVGIIRVRVTNMSGKQSPAPKKGAG